METERATSRGFASDNYSGVHPEILAAIAEVNGGHVASYGHDVYTAELERVLRSHFGDAARVFPVFNGTGANVTALQSLLTRWGAVIATATAHINTDEGGAPERIGGMKLLTAPTPDGKLTPDLVRELAGGRLDEHTAIPQAVSITQSTELGTLYTIDEIAAVVEAAHGLGLKVHLDGSRLANAAVALDADFREFTTDVGVDILSLGGTKNGALGAEAIVTLRPDLGDSLVYLRKVNMQLASKMRFISAQLLALYGTDLWARNAAHANEMATRLRAGVEGIEGVGFAHPTQANGVFAALPPGVADAVRSHFFFYDWDTSRGEVRWMTSFDTTADDVDAFVALVKQACADVA